MHESISSMVTPKQYMNTESPVLVSVNALEKFDGRIQSVLTYNNFHVLVSSG